MASNSNGLTLIARTKLQRLFILSLAAFQGHLRKMDSRHQHLVQKRTRSQRRTISASPQAVYVLERDKDNCRQSAQVKILRINIKP